jgi:plastocyanin
MNVLGLTAVALVLAGCGGSGGYGGNPTGPTSPGGGTASQSADVTIRRNTDIYGDFSFSFVPQTVTIARGGTVRWNDASAETHNIVFASTPGAPADVGTFAGGTVSRTFQTSGTFGYGCTLHAGMAGTVNVQ